MPPAVIAASVAAAGTTAGAVMQSRSANRATDAQAQATRDAMNYQREREWMQRSDARRSWDAYMRAQYGDRYPGLAAVNGTAPAPSTTTAPAAGTQTPESGGLTPSHGENVPTVEPAPPAPGVPSTQPATTLADLSQQPWSASNYSRYIGGRR